MEKIVEINTHTHFYKYYLVSLALEGRLFTTVPPGKPCI